MYRIIKVVRTTLKTPVTNRPLPAADASASAAHHRFGPEIHSRRGLSQAMANAQYRCPMATNKSALIAKTHMANVHRLAAPQPPPPTIR